MQRILVLFGILWLAFSAEAAEIIEPKPLTQEPLGKYGAWSYVLDGEGKVWVAYYGADNNLYVRRPDGSHVALGVKDRPSALSGLAMSAGSDDVSLMWRDKLPKKTLYFLPEVGSADEMPEPLIIADHETEPLTRIDLAKRDGVSYFLWYGEKGDPETNQKYHIYFRYSEDDGKTLSQVYKVLPGFYPAWIVDGGPTIPVFTWAKIDGRLMMAMRSFDRQKKTFGPIVEITEAPPISPFFHAFESKGRWFLIWLGHYGDGSELLLEGAYSDDRGETWKRFAFESIRGLDLSRLNTAADDKGHLLIALSGSWRLRDPEAKNDIYLIRSDDNGTTWSEPKLMREESLRFMEAKFPSIVFGEKEGSVMMVWEDWRDIRSRLYVNYSSDYGATWWDEALPLTPPEANVALDFKMSEALKSHNGQYHVVAKRYPNDTLKNPDLVLYTFTLDELKNKAVQNKEESENATEARLRERVDAFWQALENEDYEKTYQMYDPFFQTASSLKQYLSKMGGIQYHGHEIKQLIRQGNVARLLIETEASVPGFDYKGETITRPKQTYPVVETWVFVDGDWYREYYEEYTQIRYTRY